jgi:hypothetical protein
VKLPHAEHAQMRQQGYYLSIYYTQSYHILLLRSANRIESQGTTPDRSVLLNLWSIGVLAIGLPVVVVLCLQRTGFPGSWLISFATYSVCNVKVARVNQFELLTALHRKL